MSRNLSKAEMRNALNREDRTLLAKLSNLKLALKNEIEEVKNTVKKNRNSILASSNLSEDEANTIAQQDLQQKIIDITNKFTEKIENIMSELNEISNLRLRLNRLVGGKKQTRKNRINCRRRNTYRQKN